MPEALPGNDDTNRDAVIVAAVADTLTAHGLDIDRTHGDDGVVTITNIPGMGCRLAICCGQDVSLDYWPRDGHQPDPADIIGLVLPALDATDTPHSQDPRVLAALPLKATVGMDLAARRLSVTMDVYVDHVSYTAAADIVITNPSRPETGQVYISDSGATTWERDYHNPAGVDPGRVSASITDVLTQAFKNTPRGS